MKKCFCTLIVLFLMTMSMLSAQSTYYIKSKYAKVRKRRARKRRSDPKVRRGTKVEKVKYRRRWYKVKIEDETGKIIKGWIYRRRIKKLKKGKKLKRDESLYVGKDKGLRSGENLATGRALRGVGPVAKAYGAKNNPTKVHEGYVDYHQSFITTDKEKFIAKRVRTIEIVKISTEDLENFARVGKLGDYMEEEEPGEKE